MHYRLTVFIIALTLLVGTCCPAPAADEYIPPAALRKILDVIMDPEKQPVLIHCLGGKDRTGLLAALYKLETSYPDYAELERDKPYTVTSAPRLSVFVKDGGKWQWFSHANTGSGR